MEKLKNLLHTDFYTIAIRKRGEHTLFDGDDKREFFVLPVKRNKWFADPFIFSKDGKDYLFFEIFDVKKNKGMVGVSVISDRKIMPPITVLELPYHISYPCVFEFNNEVYMIPETTQNDDIQLYRAKEFPDKWEFIVTLKRGCKYADSTVFHYADSLFLLTFQQLNNNGNLCKLGVEKIIDLKKGVLQNIGLSSQDFLSDVRGAGKLFKYGDNYVRPSQICTPYYGYGLKFNFVYFNDREYKEKEFYKVLPTDIKINLHKKVIGTHTYCINDTYEILDIKFYRFNMYISLKRIKNYLRRKLHGKGRN